MRKYLAILGIMLGSIFCLCGCSEKAGGVYETVLPRGYDDSISEYPVVYVLPQNGYDLDDSRITELLDEEIQEGSLPDAIIIKPQFSENSDVLEEMKWIVQDVDSRYATIDSKKYRILAGTGTGGYLAYAVGLSERDLFGGMISIRGDFASEENPWCKTLGSVSDEIEKVQEFGEDYFNEVYTYLDAPVDDVWSDMEGSTNDLGAMFIEMGTSVAAHEYTVRPGEFDKDFLQESVNRVSENLTKYMLGEIITGTVKLENATLPEDEKTAKVIYSVDVANTINDFTLRDFEATVRVAVTDPVTGEVFSENSEAVKITDDGTYEGTLEVDNIVKDTESEVVLNIDIFGGSLELSGTTLRRGQGNVLDGEVKTIDLSGDWYFNYTGMDKEIDAASLSAKEYESWPVVQPGDGKWREGYGNIDKNTVSGPSEYFTYMLTGNGYYVKSFELPEEFDSADIMLSIGYVDDRCEVFVNGTKVGATGMNEAGEPNGETTWAKLSEFSIDQKLLVRGGENVIVVRAWNDEPYGEGGWYDGPVMLTGTGTLAGTSDDVSAKAESKDSERQYFFEETFKSELIDEGEYLIYLPHDYYETERFYPTVYLLHQFNSDHTSYKTDHIDEVLNDGIEKGLYDEMIVVIPNSEEESWWTGKWEKMLTEELIPHIDSKYRTINDARYRMTAGCSMGGQGAFGVALTNPEYFSGMASFFGALSMAPTMGEDAILIAGEESKEYLDYFSYSFICGNQDSYGFGVPAIDLHQILKEKEVSHNFFIENGGHDSEFYLQYFNECIGYVRSNMYQSDKAVERLVNASVKADGTKISVTFTADEKIKEYFNTIPASADTEEVRMEMNIPLIVQVVKDGEVIYTTAVKKNVVSEEQLSAEYEFDFAEKLNDTEDFEIVVKAAVFDKIVEMK